MLLIISSDFWGQKLAVNFWNQKLKYKFWIQKLDHVAIEVIEVKDVTENDQALA